MICPYCKKEKTLERYTDDPTILGCTNCHATHSETFLLGYIHGWLDRENEMKKMKDKKAKH